MSVITDIRFRIGSPHRTALVAFALVFVASIPAFAQPAPPAGPPGPSAEPPTPPAEPAPPVEPAAPPVEVAPTPPPPPVVEPTPPPEVKEKDKDKKEDPPVKITAAPGKGVTIKVGDTFSTNIKARFQPRWQLHAAPESMGDRKFDQIVNINTARIWLSGNVLDPKLTYMLQLAVAGRDYRDNAISPIFDAFMDYKAHRELAVKAGQFFVPFDRLRTVRESALQLAERPRPVAEYTLDRDTGVVLYSDNAFLGEKSPLAWRVGVFGGGGTNLSVPKEPGGLFVGRFEVRPLGKIDDDSEGDLERREKPGLAIGVGVASNRNTNRQRSTTGTTFTGGTTDYFHFAVDAVFKWKGFATQLEYLKKDAGRERIPSAADPAVFEYARSGSGFVAQASYYTKPKVELVGRFTRLWAPGGTDPKLITEIRNLGQEIATGVNYYLNGHAFKFQATWIVRSPRNFDYDNSDHLVIGQIDATF